jgi:predicted HTH transcriptional regulator
MKLWQSTQKYFHQALHELTDNQVIEWMIGQNGCITSRQLAEKSGISRNQAIIKLNAMLIKNLIEIDYHHYDPYWDNFYKLPKSDLWNPAMSLGQVKPKKTTELTDSQVIRLALQNQNYLTVAYLCAQAEVSLEEAQKKLEELYLKNVFELNINENGGLIYTLINV